MHCFRIIAVLGLTWLLAAQTRADDITVSDNPEYIQIDTDALQARIRKTGYVSGIERGTLLDKKTGARDVGFGLHIMDFLMAPGWREDDYSRDPKVHGNLPKHYIEGPQICTKARKLEPEIIRGKDFVAVRMRFRFTDAAPGVKAGSLWEQTLLFKPGLRYFLSSETITSANSLDNVFYRIDMPGHIKHKNGDTFAQVYLSYHGKIPASEFADNFGPDERFLYQRKEGQVPERMIRAYQVKIDGKPGPWLAGMTLDPGLVSEAWCHQRGYVCFIEELHGRAVKAGDTFGAAYAVGFFDDIPAMEKTCDQLRGVVAIRIENGAAQLVGQEKQFRAGAHAQDITPLKFPISVNGGMSDRQAVGTNDRLHARCLVLDDGGTRLAFAVCDSCMIPREITDAAKRLASDKTGIPPQNILISATHSHTTPTVGGVFQSDPDEAYQKYLAEQIAKGIATAVSKSASARIGWGVGKDATQVFNRRWYLKPDILNPDPFGRTTDKVRMNPGYKDLLKPAGPIDPEVSILSVQTLDGRPIALLANYSLHYVGNTPSQNGKTLLSADYFAAFAERIGQLLDAPAGFVGIMSNGTSGDINNVDFAGGPRKGVEPYEQCRLVADSVARAAFAAHKNVKHHDWVELAAATKEIELGVRLPSDSDVAEAKEILAKAKSPENLAKREEIYARETVLLAKYPPKVKAILQALRIGELGIATNPCETFVEIGLDLKKKSPLQPTFVIELANGYNGYLPTPEQHTLGGYETWRARSSYLEVDAATRISRTMLELLNQVAGK